MMFAEGLKNEAEEKGLNDPLTEILEQAVKLFQVELPLVRYLALVAVVQLKQSLAVDKSNF